MATFSINPSKKGFRAENLRYIANNESFEASPAPGRLPYIGTPLHIHHGNAGRTLLYHRSGYLYAANLDNPAAETALMTITTPPQCAVNLADNTVAISDGSTIREISISDTGNVTPIPATSVYPPLRFSAESPMTLSVTIPGRQLTGEYNSHSTQLDTADIDRLTADLIDAYDRLASSATRIGQYMQPVMARYRLLGKGGRLLYVSAPVFVGLPGGVQCLNEINILTAGSMKRRRQGTLLAQIYRLRLQICGAYTGACPEDVERLVVETSMPLHPLDRSLSACSALAPSGTDEATIRCYLPGSSIEMAPGAATSATRAECFIDRTEIAFSEVMTIENPFATSHEINFMITPRKRGTDYGARFERSYENIESRMPEQVNPVTAACMPPHRFAAAHAANIGDTVVWGDITPFRYQGYRLDQYALSTVEGVAWQGAVTVTMADGSERCVSAAWGTTDAPLTFSPLLYYPSADAATMTLLLKRGTTVYRAEYSLRPTADRRGAYYLAPDLLPMQPAQYSGNFSFPSPVTVNRLYADAVISAKISDPYNPIDATTPTASCITALAAVDRRGSTWDGHRRRLYLFSHDGIYSCSLTAKSAFTPFSRIDRRKVASPHSVTTTTHPDFPLMAVASGDLIGLVHDRVTLLKKGLGAQNTAWDSVNGELWLSDGNTTHVISDVRSDIGYRETRFAPTSMVSDAESMVVQSGNALFDTATPSEAATTPFSYTTEVEISPFPVKLQEISLDIAGAGIDAILKVEIPDEGNTLLSALRVSGSPDSPLRVSLPRIKAGRLRISVGGSTSGFFRLRAFHLHYKP